ncbi:TPA: dATP/dGTP pyrophosphohydrolase domain-containing protein, partial [Salmonella enterica]
MTITREQQKQILIDTANHVISRDNTSPYSENLRELARIALASLEAEPIGAFHIADQQVGGTSDYIKDGEWPIDNGVIEVYAAPPASEREQIRREHAEWSDATFGDVGPVGPLKHLSKEALEAAAEPEDLSEWADMQFLLWDAQRRAGITDKQITLAMVEKLAVNKKREWPEPKDGEPRLHIKEQPA